MVTIGGWMMLKKNNNKLVIRKKTKKQNKREKNIIKIIDTLFKVERFLYNLGLRWYTSLTHI